MKGHITIVDNNEEVRKMLTHFLKRSGCQTSSYTYNTVTLLNLLLPETDLIVLDFNEEDGGLAWQFLQMLKMEEETASIPILIMVTPLQLSVEIENYLLRRYISVVYKSFKLTVFLRLIEHTLTQASQAGVIFSSKRVLPILVVDDTEELRKSTLSVLSLERYQAIGVENGKMALDAVSRAEYCLILLDLAMPVMSGFEFLTAYGRQLRPHSPVIVISGERSIQTQLFPPFVVDFLTKPFEVPLLLKLVGKYAQREMI